MVRILLIAILFISGIADAQEVGRVLSAAGEVMVSRAGRDFPLATGALLENGDVVRTGAESTVQIRFADESLVALRAKSRFEVADFRFTGSDDGVSRAVLGLLQGGMRTLTGLIGRTYRDRYSLRSPLATVGIRGTAFSLVLCQGDCFEAEGVPAPDGAYGEVFDGRVSVANDAGEIEFAAEEAFFVASRAAIPQPLVGRPGFLRDRQEARARREQQMRAAIEARREQATREAIAASRLSVAASTKEALQSLIASGRATVTPSAPNSPIVAVTDLRDDSGNIALVGVGLGAGVGFATQTDAAAIVDGGAGAVVVLDKDRGVLEQFSFNFGAQQGDRQQSLVLDGGKVTGDGGAVWGRWSPGAAVSVGGQAGVPPTGVHFFFGNLTPESTLHSVPAGATAVRYEYVGGPRPTDAQGNAGQFLGGVFTVNFVQRTLGGQLDYRVDTTTYHLPVPDSTPLVAGRGFVGFTTTQRNAGSWQCSCSGTSGSIDQYSVSGLFLGSRAQGLGVNFATVDAQAGRTAGAAVLQCPAAGCR
jgi:hypothetical protein